MNAQSASAIQPAKNAVPVTQGIGDLMQELDRLNDSIAQRAFELFEGNGHWLGHDLDDWLRAESEVLHPLHLEMRETGDAFTIEAEVPGFAVKDLEINVEPRSLRIAGRREVAQETKEKGKVVGRERCSDQIMRVIGLPTDVDATKVTASLDKGILTLHLPKATPAKPVRIEPKAS